MYGAPNPSAVKPGRVEPIELDEAFLELVDRSRAASKDAPESMPLSLAFELAQQNGRSA